MYDMVNKHDLSIGLHTILMISFQPTGSYTMQAANAHLNRLINDMAKVVHLQKYESK